MLLKEDVIIAGCWKSLEVTPLTELSNCTNRVVVGYQGDFGLHEGNGELYAGTANFRTPPLKDNSDFIFCTNLNTNRPNHEMLPLGLANLESLTHINNNFGNKERGNLLYCNFGLESNREYRPRIWALCTRLHFAVCKQFQSDQTYFRDLSNSKFVLCPMGNGMDTYRVWETLYSGAIPILMRSNFADRIAQIFPALVVDDLEELHKKYLINEYERLQGTLKPERLTPQWWVNRINFAKTTTLFSKDGQIGHFKDSITEKPNWWPLRFWKPTITTQQSVFIGLKEID